jgi:hypothetical protein
MIFVFIERKMYTLLSSGRCYKLYDFCLKKKKKKIMRKFFFRTNHFIFYIVYFEKMVRDIVTTVEFVFKRKTIRTNNFPREIKHKDNLSALSFQQNAKQFFDV